MKTDKFILLLLWCAFLPLYSVAQISTNPDPVFVQDSLYKIFCKDVEFVIDKIENTYINGRRGVSDEQWSRYIEMIYEKGRNSKLRTNQYYYALRYLGLLINDGHFRFPDGGVFNRNKIFKKDNVIFPIRVKTWEDGSVYTVRDYTGILPKDAQIISVNGRSAKNMALLSRSLYSGEDQYAMDKMNLYSEPSPRDWNNFTNFLFMEQIRPPYHVEYIIPNSDTLKKVTIKGMKRQDIYKLYRNSGDKRAVEKTRGGNFFSKAVRYRKVDSDIAVLSINSFWGKNLVELLLTHKDKTYPRQLKRAMKKINKDGVEDLIIDISTNGGGMADNLYKTLNYFADEPIDAAIQYTVTEENRKITGIRAMNSVGKYLGVSREDRKRLGAFVDTLPVGTTFCTDTLFPVVYRPNNPKHRYKGNVYVLTSNYTYSAAQMFAQYVQKRNIGKIAGQPCGGYSVITGGNSDFAELPGDGRFLPMNIPTTLNKRYIGIDTYEYDRVDIPIERPFDEWLKDERNSLDRLIEIIKSKKEDVLTPAERTTTNITN